MIAWVSKISVDTRALKTPFNNNIIKMPGLVRVDGCVAYYGKVIEEIGKSFKGYNVTKDGAHYVCDGTVLLTNDEQARIVALLNEIEERLERELRETCAVAEHKHTSARWRRHEGI